MRLDKKGTPQQALHKTDSILHDLDICAPTQGIT